MPDLYSDGAHYDALLGGQTADIAFYLKQAKAARGPVLELACGTGRITLELAWAGIDVTGVDLSGAMLLRARAKAADSPARFVQADMRAFDLGRRFDLVFLPYNSMEHLHDRASLEAMLACVRSHLNPGGRFILDVHQPSLALLSRRPGEIYPVDEMGATAGGLMVTGEEVFYDDATQIYRIRWHYSAPDGQESRVDELNLRMFFPQELDALLQHNGFKILKKFGDFTETPYGLGALKQVLILE